MDILSSKSVLISIIVLIAQSMICLPGRCQPARVDQFDASVIREAFDGDICEGNINVMIKGSDYQNSPDNDSVNEPQRHWQTRAGRCYRYLRNEQKKVVIYARTSDVDPQMRTRTLFHLGMLLHTAGVFYKNTDYLWKRISSLEKKHAAYDPYSLPLFDFSTLEDDGNLVSGLEPQRLDTPIGKTTLGKVARGLAIREARRQWSYMAELIRLKYADRASMILAALKRASCENLEPPELVD